MHVEPDEDAKWMLQVAQGDRAAFAKLFDRHQQRVVRFCHRFVGDAGRAEELAQDVFVKLYRSAARYQQTARFQTFLFRVATNTCLNELRRPGRTAEKGEAAVEDDAIDRASAAETPDQVLEAKDVEKALQRALENMSDRERAAFTMCRFEGMAYRDIADALEATEAAVKSLIHRASLQVLKHLDALKNDAIPEGNAA
ncbi:MAG: sigma-70 family RNA polymerase sigma factor [Archangium sp.]|nr:sigma-70 family RNA polymerase sigma factor [Archangium sp.]MDP3574203.1 sigma-70 family RNA polymerase sigma factor [Archangium sp.]